MTGLLYKDEAYAIVGAAMLPCLTMKRNFAKIRET